jgi:inosose dehydratase
MGIADPLPGAPISWGVCEAPGWGWQLDSATVLSQMQEVGLVATEFGPDGFLPDEPQAKAKTLADNGLRAVGGFVPVVPHDPASDPVREIEHALAGFTAACAGALVLAALTGTDGYDVRPVPGDDGGQVLLTNLDRLALVASRIAITATVHLLIGGTGPVALGAEHAGRIRHTHLKDVDATWARRVQSGEVTYTDAVRPGMYRTLGRGGVDIASIVDSLERAGYDGCYVLEQDTILDGPAASGPPVTGDQAPIADVRASIEHLFAIAQVLP